MSIHNIRFLGEIRKVIPQLSPNTHTRQVLCKWHKNAFVQHFYRISIHVERHYMLLLLNLFKSGHSSIYQRSGSVVECQLFDREVAGSIPSRVIPKTLKLVLAALLLGAQH